MKLIPLIASFLETRAKNDAEKVNGIRDYFHISEVDKCQRAIYYKMKGYPGKGYSAGTYRKLENGDYVHRRLMSMITSIGVVIAAEIRIPEEKIFHGRADAIVSIDNDPYVLEIKSMNSYAFKRLEDPDKAHLKQIQLYMHYFNIDKGIILVENKDNQELKEFVVAKDEKILQEISANFISLKKMFDDNTLPPKPKFSRNDKWKCDYCAYKKTCEEND